VAINLPSETRLVIEKSTEDLRGKLNLTSVGARFVKPDNWHVTLSFLGYQDEPRLKEISEAVISAAGRFVDPEINFRDIAYGPLGEKKVRMVWAVLSSETSKKLSEIKSDLEGELIKAGIHFGLEDRPFAGHITLARFRNKTSLNDLPVISRDTNLSFVAKSLDLMESELKRSGAEYVILQKCKFSAVE